jgi:hypothetical protein
MINTNGILNILTETLGQYLSGDYAKQKKNHLFQIMQV